MKSRGEEMNENENDGPMREHRVHHQVHLTSYGICHYTDKSIDKRIAHNVTMLFTIFDAKN